MDHYEQEIELYFELKGTSASSKESYFRRINAFVNHLIDRHNATIYLSNLKAMAKAEANENVESKKKT